jgi:lipopolysaccharide export LptBFGC system permease protein LptF
MMPVLWIHLWKSWARTLGLAVAALLGLLLVTRLHEAARLAALGAHLSLLGKFLLYQIPELLPLVLPAGGAIAGWMTAQQLASSRQLAALRSCGMSTLRQLLPCLYAAILLGICTTYVTSQWATKGHRANRELAASLTRAHPYLLIQNSGLLANQGLFVKAHASSATRADQLVVALRPTRDDPIHLLLADRMETQSDQLRLVNPLLISSAPGEEGSWPTLVLDQSKQMQMPLLAAAQMLRAPTRPLRSDHLELGLLLARRESTDPNHRLSIDQELIRRIATGLGALAMAWAGCAFGLFEGRGRRTGAILPLLAMGAVMLALYFATKELSANRIHMIMGYWLPPLAIVALSTWRVVRR